MSNGVYVECGNFHERCESCLCEQYESTPNQHQREEEAHHHCGTVSSFFELHPEAMKYRTRGGFASHLDIDG